MQQPLFQPTYLNLEYFFNKILEIFAAIFNFFTNSNAWGSVNLIIKFVIIFLIAIMFYSYIRIREMRKEEHEHLAHLHAETAQTASPVNQKWDDITTKISSDNPSDWRLAIIEADTILDEILIEIMPEGESLGDRLTKLSPGGFRTIRSAWDAHTVRNKIAHQGSDFELTRQEARRVIGLYEEVFREFKYI